MSIRLAIFLLLMLFPAAGLAAELPQTVTAADGSKMALVPAGKFSMGSEDADIKEIASWHDVNVDAFYMDVYEVTNQQFAEFLNDRRPAEGQNRERWNWVVIRNDIETDDRFSWWPTEILYESEKYIALEGFKDHPVLTVNWYAADEYCKWAGKRLPTEAEWEKAARGGLDKKRFSWGDEIPTGGVIFDKEWKDNAAPPPTGKVGSYFPNGYGLHDMAGNAWEWVADWFDPFYYAKSEPSNPKGPKTGEIKTIRGGAWHNAAMALRVAIRNTEHPMSTSDGVGFRCAKDAVAQTTGEAENEAENETKK